PLPIPAPLCFPQPPPPDISTLSLHDALPICHRGCLIEAPLGTCIWTSAWKPRSPYLNRVPWPHVTSNFVLQRSHPQNKVGGYVRSEEHTSELQSLAYLVCRLLLAKTKKKKT